MDLRAQEQPNVTPSPQPQGQAAPQPQPSSEMAQTEMTADEAGNAIARVGELMKKPAVGGSVAGAIALGAAVVFGAWEAAVGAGVAYVAYRLLRKKTNPPQQ
jgi:hypothetical protein